MAPKKTLVEQLRGATKLAVHATREGSRAVEEMHHTIVGGVTPLSGPLRGLSEAFNGPGYSLVRGVAGVVGAGIDLALARLEPTLQTAGAERGVLLAALNGVVGDHLARTENPLAIEMRLCSGGATLDLDTAALKERFPSGDRLLILLHGSSVDDQSWRRNGHDHGEALAKERGFVPLYLRYNSGLHVSENGRQLASLLEKLVFAWPRPVHGLTFLAHSMGGLVARSACLVAEEESLSWRTQLKTLISLGTPHHGAPLERSGNWADLFLASNRYSAPLATLAKLRSAGVTDLRYGNVLDEHWRGRDRFERAADPRGGLLLPAGVDCFAIAATTSKTLSASLPGDGLVPVDSALGRHGDATKTLQFPVDRQWIAVGASHLDLLDRRDVYEKLLGWL